MQLSRDIILMFLILFMVSSCGDHYNDLIDYGYKGKVRKAILIDYLNPKDSSGEWYADREPRFTKTTIFNNDGMAIEESFVLGDRAYTRRFTVKGVKRIACNETGDESDYSKYTYTDSTITEMEYDSSGSLIGESVISIDKNKLTTKEVFKNYHNKSVTGYTIYFYGERVDGYVSKFLSYDSLTNIKNAYENVILSKDDKNNPTKIIRKNEGRPESLRVLKFEYR